MNTSCKRCGAYTTTEFCSRTCAESRSRHDASPRQDDLGTLLHKNGSDKDTNGYAPFYAAMFDPWRNERLTLIEIGIGTLVPGAHSSMYGHRFSEVPYRPGASLRAWRDYFPNAEIIGVDPQPDTQFSEERIRTIELDSTNKEALAVRVRQGEFDTVGNRFVPPVRIIIDDGSHEADDQLATIEAFWPLLAPGGLYVIEDLRYPDGPLHANPGLIEARAEGCPVFFVGLHGRLGVIRKAPLVTRREWRFG